MAVNTGNTGPESLDKLNNGIKIPKFAKETIIALSSVATAVLATGCGQNVEAQTADPVKVEVEMPEAEVQKMAQLSQATQPRIINASISVPEPTQELDISKLSKDQLQQEIEVVEIKIAKLEADMDSFTDDDSRWDTLESYAQNLLVLERAQTATATKREDEATKREDEATAMNYIAKELSGIN